jgi:hypothetical protein
MAAAILTEIGPPGATSEYRVYQTQVVPVGTSLELSLLDPQLVNNRLGVSLFSNDAGTTPAAASGGTFAVTAFSIESPQVAEAVHDSPITATSLVTLEWAGHCDRVTVTPSGVAGAATHYRVILSQAKRYE